MANQPGYADLSSIFSQRFNKKQMSQHPTPPIQSSLPVI